MILEDTIAALSSPAPAAGQISVSILRLSGPQTFPVLEELTGRSPLPRQRGLFHAAFIVEGLPVSAAVYTFAAPHSYTGQDMAELHVLAAAPLAERLLARLTSRLRPARPGEFTLRAYLNGRMDLTQAEAVAQIVSGSNAAQVAAAEKLLAGHLSKTIAEIRNAMLDWLCQIEAGLDFAEEQIQILPPEQAVQILQTLRNQIEQMLSGPIQYERMIDLPSVGIAGAVNAGKSSLLNALLGRPRSIVSDVQASTRDVVRDILSLGDLDCVLFDCAGLSARPPQEPLDALARQAALAALQKADLVLFCVDISKSARQEDAVIFTSLRSRPLLALATQCDRVPEQELPACLSRLQEEFGCSFLAVSSQTGFGLSALREQMRQKLLSLRGGTEENQTSAALSQRHRRILSEVSDSLAEASRQIELGREEIAAMLIRTAWEQLGGFERENIEEHILEQIFSRFCIGK